MKIKPSAGSVFIFTILVSAAGFCLRTAFNVAGGAAALIVLSALAVVIFAALSFQLPRSTEAAKVFRISRADLVLSLIGAILLGVGCTMSICTAEGAEQYISIMGVLGAVGLIAAAWMRFSGKKHAVWPYFPIIFYYVMKLFLDFRRWMVDPAVLDYCFMLFAAICFMLTSYHEGAFCFDKGNRRLLGVFAMCGVFFGVMSLSDAAPISALLYGGSIAWMMACVSQSVREKH